jgi:hypothetical protein
MTGRVQLQKKGIFGIEPQGVWRQNEPIGGNPVAVAGAWDSLGTQRKENVRCCKPLPSNG